MAPPARRHPPFSRRVRGGFTLIELLVALVLTAGMVAVVLPIVVQQIQRIQAVRAANDLVRIGTGVRHFQLDLYPAFPGDLEDLVYAVDPDDRQLLEVAYSGRQSERWTGSYIEPRFAEGGVLTGDAVVTGFDSKIQQQVVCFDSEVNESISCMEGPGVFVALEMQNIRAGEFELINDIIDGEGEDDTLDVWGVSDSRVKGRLRLMDSGGISPELQTNFVYFLITPLFE